MILGKSLHLVMTSQTAVSMFDLNLYFMVRWLCKFALTSLPRRRDIAFCGILVQDFLLKENIQENHNVVVQYGVPATF